MSRVVLVVDDDVSVRRILAKILTRDGYAVVTACDGHEALHFLRELEPSVIFVDLHMPRMDGAQFREMQRRDRRWLAIPTVVMTGSDDEALLDLAVRATLKKPVRSDQLRSVMQDALSAAS